MTRTFTQGIKKALRRSGAFDLISRTTARGRVDIALYHSLCDGSQRDPRFPQSMPVANFEEHIRLIARYGRPLSLEKLAEQPAAGIAVTFDDGYTDNYRLAFPVLQKYRIPATIFVTTGFIDRKSVLWGDWLEYVLMNGPRSTSEFKWRGAPIKLDLSSHAAAARRVHETKLLLRREPLHDIHAFLRDLEWHFNIHYGWDVMPDSRRPLEWDQIRVMRKSGLVSFGAHTVSHPALSRCTPEVQRNEIFESKRRLEEELREPCTLFAYPYGERDDYTLVTKQIVKDAGYSLALSAQSGFNRLYSYDPFELRRWGGDTSVDDMSFLMSGGPVVTALLKDPFANRPNSQWGQ